MQSTILLAFGRIDSATKGDLVPLLIALGELTRKRYDPLHLVIAGNSANPQEVYRLERIAQEMGCREHLVIRTLPTQAEAPLYYAAADIFVAISDTLQETFGLAPVEAMATGLPVIASDWSGFRATIVDGQTGLLIPTLWGDVCDSIDRSAPLMDADFWQEPQRELSRTITADTRGLYEALEILVKNHDLRQKMGDAGRQRAIDHFGWRNVIPHYLALWNELGAVAAHCKPPSEALLDLHCPRYYDSFRGYATQTLTERSPLQPGGFSASVREQAYRSLCQEGWLVPQERGALATLLRYVQRMSFLRQTVRVDEIAARFGRRYALDRDRVHRLLLSAAKYGLIRVDNPQERGERVMQRRDDTAHHSSRIVS